MKLLVRVGAFVVGLVTFCATMLTIVDYALNKPEVVEATFGPGLRYFQAWILEPLTRAIGGLSGAHASTTPAADSFSSIAAMAILVVTAVLLMWLASSRRRLGELLWDVLARQ